LRVENEKYNYLCGKFCCNIYRKRMEATVVKIGSSLGFKVPETVVKDFNLKAGNIVEMNFMHNGELVLRRKPKIREGWSAEFAQYALEGEDMQLLPDFFDSETDNLL